MARVARRAWQVGGLVAGAAAGLAAFSSWNARRAERLVPPDGAFIDVEGARLHYVDVGSGPAIVMIHGLGGQLRNFTYALSGRLQGRHRLVIVDRPGSGYSRYVGEGEQGLAAQGAIIARLIDALGLERPLVVGHSLGGAVALALALDHPAKVGGLALLAPLTQAVEAIPQAFKALAIQSTAARRLVAWTLAAPLGRLSGEQARRTIFGPEPVPEGFEIAGGAALTLRPSAFEAAAADVAASAREMAALAGRYAELSLPVGILFARGDQILPFALHGEQTAAAMSPAELTLIDGGHMFPVTQPDLTAEWIAQQMNA